MTRYTRAEQERLERHWPAERAPESEHPMRGYLLFMLVPPLAVLAFIELTHFIG